MAFIQSNFDCRKQLSHALRFEVDHLENYNFANLRMERERANQRTGHRVISTKSLSRKGNDGVRPKVMI